MPHLCSGTIMMPSLFLEVNGSRCSTICEPSLKDSRLWLFSTLGASFSLIVSLVVLFLFVSTSDFVISLWFLWTSLRFFGLTFSSVLSANSFLSSDDLQEDSWCNASASAKIFQLFLHWVLLTTACPFLSLQCVIYVLFRLWLLFY